MGLSVSLRPPPGGTPGGCAAGTATTLGREPVSGGSLGAERLGHRPATLGRPCGTAQPKSLAPKGHSRVAGGVSPRMISGPYPAPRRGRRIQRSFRNACVPALGLSVSPGPPPRVTPGGSAAGTATSRFVRNNFASATRAVSRPTGCTTRAERCRVWGVWFGREHSGELSCPMPSTDANRGCPAPKPTR